MALALSGHFYNRWTGRRRAAISNHQTHDPTSYLDRFDSGAIEVLSVADPADIQPNIRRDNASDFAQWFHFSLQGAAGWR